MKIMTIIGTRPEIIRLSRVIPVLDELCDHVLVHTGQNYDELLNEVFFKELALRPPNIALGIRGSSFGDQVGRILTATEEVLLRERPDRVLILGDTNSGLAAFVAKRLGIPVYHMEAGNRCFDDRVPEEVNRRVIDHCSDVLMPYTERSRANLLREGIPSDRIHVIGNPILEVLEAQEDPIAASTIHSRMALQPGEYLLATTHREENVDGETRLRAIARSLADLRQQYELPVVWVIHPRTRRSLDRFQLGDLTEALTMVEPLGLHDFVALEREAKCVLSDSGTVQEECCIMHVPNVTLRDVTERPETVDCGSNILAGVESADVLRAVSVALSAPPSWDPPREYLERSVSRTVANIVLGFRHAEAAEHVSS